MTEPEHHISRAPSRAGREERLKTHAVEPTKEPDWTRGLKRLYDQVLEEPVPDTFKDLLSKLDIDTKQ
jgi:hypothetical protein